MPAISITDDQRERLRWIQRRLEEDVEYGHVRPCDALEYLLDRFDVDDAAAGSQSDAERTESVDDSGETTAFEVLNGVDGAVVDTGYADTDDYTDDDADTDDDTDADARGHAVETDGVGTDGAADETRLNSVMSLLDDNAEVWREASGGEEKYEVDLPDGTTERARTRDDVRALLFEHYR